MAIMENIHKIITDIIAEMRDFKRYAASDSSDCRYVAYWLYQTFADRLEAALRAAISAPRKNCDVGTADEQLKRFKDFCRMISKDEICDGCPLLAQCSTLEHCTLAWAQMPYEDGCAK